MGNIFTGSIHSSINPYRGVNLDVFIFQRHSKFAKSNVGSDTSKRTARISSRVRSPGGIKLKYCFPVFSVVTQPRPVAVRLSLVLDLDDFKPYFILRSTFQRVRATGVTGASKCLLCIPGLLTEKRDPDLLLFPHTPDDGGISSDDIAYIYTMLSR